MVDETPAYALKRELSGAVLVALFCALTAAGAYIYIPLPSPVPITLQTFFVLLSGAVLGPKLGAYSQALYICLGAFGLPIFAGGGAGVGELLSARGGYLFGFVIAAAVTGWGWNRCRDMSKRWRLATKVASLLSATFLIYATGVTQLSVVAELTPLMAVTIGMLPFIPGDLLKVVACWLVAERLNRFRTPEN